MGYDDAPPHGISESRQPGDFLPLGGLFFVGAHAVLGLLTGGECEPRILTARAEHVLAVRRSIHQSGGLSSQSGDLSSKEIEKAAGLEAFGDGGWSGEE